MASPQREQLSVGHEAGARLNYASADLAERHRMTLLPGALSFAAVVFQALWFCFCVFGTLAGYFGSASQQPLSGVGGAVFMWWPIFVAFALGCYSIYAARGSLRNMLGILGLIVSGTILVLGF